MLLRRFTTFMNLPTTVKCAAILLIAVISLVYALTYSRPNETYRAPTKKRVIHVGVDACGDRMSEAVTLTKSILLFTKTHIHLHLFLSQNMKTPFTKMLSSLPSSSKMKISFTVYDIGYPSGENFEMWKSIHKPCASQHLFYTDRLPHVDAIINFDIDIILLRPIDDLWDHFNKFSDMQLFAAVPRDQPDRESLKQFTNGIPHYGQEGLNTGLVLMNLTRMRQFNWTTKALKYFYQYKHLDPKQVIDDQVISGIIFYFYPDLIYILDCVWNFRISYCRRREVENQCKNAEYNGVSIVHGMGETFHKKTVLNQYFPTFAAVFKVFHEHRLGVDSVATLVKKLKAKERSALKELNPYRHKCRALYWTFTKLMEKYTWIKT